MSESLQLPPKPEVALALLQTAMSVYVHLDPRPSAVRVPPWFKKQPQLVLQVGLNMAVPIPDLDVGAEALTCTLSFNRKPEYCWIPWSAIYGLVGDDGRGMIWPDSVPAEVAAAAEGRATSAKAEAKRPRLQVAGSQPPEPATGSEQPSTDPGVVEPTPPVEAGPRAASKKARGGRSRAAKPTAVPPRSPEDGEDAGKPADAASASAQTKSDETKGPARKRELPPYLRIVK